MRPLTAQQIRSSLVNARPSVAAEMTLPGLHEIIWDRRDFLGWHDVQAPQRAYISYWRVPHPGADPQPTTILLRVPSGSPRADRLGMCAFCGTQAPARLVRLFTAPLAGPDGERGHTVGTYLCDDLCCSLTLRNTRPHDLQADLSGFIKRRVERLQTKLDGFVSTVVD